MLYQRMGISIITYTVQVMTAMRGSSCSTTLRKSKNTSAGNDCSILACRFMSLSSTVRISAGAGFTGTGVCCCVELGDIGSVLSRAVLSFLEIFLVVERFGVSLIPSKGSIRPSLLLSANSRVIGTISRCGWCHAVITVKQQLQYKRHHMIVREAMLEMLAGEVLARYDDNCVQFFKNCDLSALLTKTMSF